MSALPQTDALRRATAAQRDAADPARSVWVEASAGSGKTKVLTDRILTLMLEGTPPARILCLTFTKAAAGEMANRLAARLAEWSTATDAHLTEQLHGLLGKRMDLAEEAEALLRRARRLFAAMLDAPGGMKIQTIHAFCQSVLARFPLEAGIAPNFQVLAEGGAQEMLAEARESVLTEAAREGGPLAEAVDVVADLAGEESFDELVSQLIAQHVRLRRLFDRYGNIEGVIAAVHAALGTDPDLDSAQLCLEACADSAFDGKGLTAVAQALAAGTAREQDSLTLLQRWIEAEPPERARLLTDYQFIYLTNDGAVRKRLLTKSAQAAVPMALSAMEREAERLRDLRQRCNACLLARATAALLRIGAAILAAYEGHKAARALLDYDDLILKTRDLLAGDGRAAWVLYKLDGGLDHLLVDEAQDTNPDQWAVIKALTAEFFAGEGARESLRTVFAVGDPKQSIYSFQRADPRQFAAAGLHFESASMEARLGWTRVPLEVSFRSTAAVLSAVDAVFARAEAQRGLMAPEDAPIRHAATRLGQAGLVELWPPAEPPEEEDFDPWATTDAQEGNAALAPTRLAQLLAAKIAAWTQGGDPDGESWLTSKQRPLRPGDILVLVRRRNAFVDDLVRALKQRAVPVAGVDRMLLNDQLVVMDLVALGRVLLLPEDDLTLATVLKGPLIGLSEEQLFTLAYDRGGSLWESLQGQAEQDSAFAQARDRLLGWMQRADFTPPFELFSQVLGRDRGRAMLLARLGPEAADALDEFLNLALAYERDNVPSLEGFLHWLELGEQEVKRDMEQGQDAVRVMTVHGAKGLQAPVVILPDTLQGPPPQKGLFWETEDFLESNSEGLAFWSPRSAFDVARTAAARQAARDLRAEEYRRLLYVAMTRAEDRLYVAGWAGRRAAPLDCWYNLVRAALEEAGTPVEFDFTDLLADGWHGTGWRLAQAQEAAAEETAAPAAPAVLPQPLPAWAGRDPQPESVPPRPLAPSRPEGPEELLASPLGTAERAADQARRFKRGRLIHRLLQSLPDLPAERRAAAGARFLAAAVHELPEDVQHALLQETLRVLEDPAFAPLFGPGSRAEVPLVGLIEGREGPEAISGQVDRLLVADDQIAVIDYKTNRPPPRDATEVPPPYLRQMAAYRSVLEEIYPGRPVRCLLLWTDGPFIMQLSDAQLAGEVA